MVRLAALLEQLARAGTSVHVRQGRLGLSPQKALARFAPLLRQHKPRLLELAEAAGGVLPPERLAELAQELAEPPGSGMSGAVDCPELPAAPEIFTPATLEHLLEQGVTRPTVVELEGTGKIRIYPTREWWERGRRGDDTVEFYAAELRRALPMLRDAWARKLLSLKRAFGDEVRELHAPQPEPAPQLAPWARAVLEGADRGRVSYPLLLELVEPEPEVRLLTRLCLSRDELAHTLAELSRYQPTTARLLKTRSFAVLLSVGPDASPVLRLGVVNK